MAENAPARSFVTCLSQESHTQSHEFDTNSCEFISSCLLPRTPASTHSPGPSFFAMRAVAFIREQGIPNRHTADADFHRFKNLEIVNPLKALLVSQPLRSRRRPRTPSSLAPPPLVPPAPHSTTHSARAAPLNHSSARSLTFGPKILTSSLKQPPRSPRTPPRRAGFPSVSGAGDATQGISGIAPVSCRYRIRIAPASHRYRFGSALRPHCVRTPFALPSHSAFRPATPPHSSTTHRTPPFTPVTSISANRSSVSPSTAHGSANTRRWQATNLSARAPGSSIPDQSRRNPFGSFRNALATFSNYGRTKP